MTARRTKISPFVAIIALFIAAATFIALGQNSGERIQTAVQSGDAARQTSISDQLRDLLAPVGVAVGPNFKSVERERAKQFRVRWETSSPNKSTPSVYQTAGNLTIKQFQMQSGGLPRRRSVALAETEVLIVGIDDASRLVWWHTMADPRVLRSESVGANGEVSGQILFLPNADFAIDFPDEPSIKELRLYHPQWTGKNFQLTLIGTISVP